MHLNIFLIIVIVGLVAWGVSGTPGALVTAVAVLALMVFNHLWHIRLLTRWLSNPDPETIPPGRGVWDHVFGDLYRMMRRQRQSESRLTATLEDFQQAGAAMPDGLVILDPDHRIEWCNPVAEQHFGLDRARDFGQSITYLVRQPQFVDYLKRENYSEPLTLRQSRGAEYVLSVQLVPYGDRQTLVLSRDITDLERVETIRRDFVANVSHELRTPLTVVCGFLLSFCCYACFLLN